MEQKDNPLVRLSFHFQDGVSLQWNPGAPIPQAEVMRALGQMAARVNLPLDIELEDVPVRPELTDMDKHMLSLAFIAICAQATRAEFRQITDEFRENVRHVAKAVGVYDEKLEAVISL